MIAYATLRADSHRSTAMGWKNDTNSTIFATEMNSFRLRIMIFANATTRADSHRSIAISYPNEAILSAYFGHRRPHIHQMA
jgi:hypothetical protein